MPDFSVVVPIYNEEDSIAPLYFSLKRVMDSLKKPYEIIFINDGSQDNTLEALKGLTGESAGLCIIDLNMRRGKSQALQAGFDRAQGKIIITLDGDLQNDPADIPRLLNKMEEGYDVVCGWRRIRRDPWAKKAASDVANYIRRIFFHENLHDVGCALRVYTAASIKGLRLYRQRHRFLTALLKKQGARIGEVEVEHRFRRSGYSKYGTLVRLFSSIPDFCALLREYYLSTPKISNPKTKNADTREQ
ncbi:MAG: glycosyltransferase family 2 protein [Candidatus Omnitrophota bacterium]|jgi:glycosyltransferase involved in cell wall biosynthesis